MFKTIEQIKKANQNSGMHWFDKSTMRFFGTRLHDRVYGGRYFVMSEQPPHGKRVYGVVHVAPDGSCDRVDVPADRKEQMADPIFSWAFRTSKQAHAFAAHLEAVAAS